MVKPLVLTIGGVEHIINAGSSLVMGRNSNECDLTFNRSTISKKHATLSHESDGQVYLTDHKSTNGTYYNNIPITNRQQIDVPSSNSNERGKLRLGMCQILHVQRRDEVAEKSKRRTDDTEYDIQIPPEITH